MDWLRSEDLKEEKNVTAPIVSIAGVALAGGMCHGHMREGFLPLVFPPKQRDSVPDPTQEMDLDASPSVFHPMTGPARWLLCP